MIILFSPGKVCKMHLKVKRFRLIAMLIAVSTAFASNPAESWKDQANEQIAGLRQSEVQLQVVDEHGKPAKGIKIEIRQIRKAFPFGAAMSWVLLRNERYAEFFRDHFNWAVFENESKWYSNERFQGRED